MAWNRALLVLTPLSLAAALVAPTSAQPGDAPEQGEVTHDVTFYGHVFGHTFGSPMPANTERPIGEDSYGLGSFNWCEPTGTVFATCEQNTTNRLVLFSTAGFVDVKDRAEFAQQGGYIQLHNERGQTKDIVLDQSRSITASIYVSVDYHAWSVGNPHGTFCAYPHPPDVPCLYPYWGWDPGLQPDFVVEAGLYKATLGPHGANASDEPPIEAAWEDGDVTLIAEGRWGPQTVGNGLPDMPNVNEFVIDLGPPKVPVIERDQDFFLVYSFYSETSETKWGVHTWRIWSGEFFAPTFTMPVQNAFAVERVIPNFAHGKLALLGVMNTPWGSYDIDPASVELTVMRGSQEVLPEHMQRFGEFSVAHGGHYLPINVTWIWDYVRDGLEPGAYELTVSAENFQGSAAASCSARFELAQARNGRLVPGSIDEGVCGVQTATEEFLEGIQAGVS